jgi:hypothetical protein
MGISQSAVIDKENSTTTLIAGGGTFTGRAVDCSVFSSITVFIYSDVASATNGLSLELSTDGVNWDRKKQVTVKAGVSQVHSLAVVSQYFRITYTNGSSAQSEFRLQTICHVSKSRDLSSGTEQVIQKYDDVALQRLVSDVVFDRNVGRIGYETTTTVHGAVTNLDTTQRSLWEYAATADVVFPTAAETVRVRSGGNAADTSDGDGARTVTVVGLDENWAEATETITLAGASASSATTTTFIRVNEFKVATVGVYGAANTGNIILENTTTNAVLGYITAGESVMFSATYSVPAGKTAYVVKELFEVSIGNTASIFVYHRKDSDDATSAPFTPAVLVEQVLDFEGVFINPHDTYLALPAKTDYYVEAKKVSGGGTASVSTEIDLIVVDD